MWALRPPGVRPKARGARARALCVSRVSGGGADTRGGGKGGDRVFVEVERCGRRGGGGGGRRGGGGKEGGRKEVEEAGGEGAEDEEGGNESGGEREGNEGRGEMEEPGEGPEEEARRGREVEGNEVENERGRGRGAVVASREKGDKQEEFLDEKGGASGNVETGDVETAEKVANEPGEGPSRRKIGRKDGAKEEAADAEGNHTPATESGPREVRRRRTPSSKFRDMQVILKRGRRSSIQSKTEEALEGIEEQKPVAEEKEEVEEGRDGAGDVDNVNAKGGRSNKRPHDGVERTGSKRERRRSRGNEG
jgi:hypothetical protein